MNFVRLLIFRIRHHNTQIKSLSVSFVEQHYSETVICRCSSKKVFVKNFTIFTGKHLCWILFLIFLIIKERLQHRCFPVNIAKLLRNLFFSIWVSFHEHSRFTEQQGKWDAISLTPLYHFQTLQKHLDISRLITAESSPLHIASTRTRTGNLCFRAHVANH